MWAFAIASAAISSCPNGFSSPPGDGAVCYNVINDKLNWVEAEQRCSELAQGGHLATVDTAARNRHVGELVRHSVTTKDYFGRAAAWIGLTSRHTAHAPGQRSNCDFYWAADAAIGNATSPNFTHFARGEPNNWAGKEQCVQVVGDRWNDDDCSGGYAAISREMADISREMVKVRRTYRSCTYL